jgi:hypothetical protein
MLAQVAQAIRTQMEIYLPAMLNGRLSTTLSNQSVPRALTGNPDNEYRTTRRHRRRLSKNILDITRSTPGRELDCTLSSLIHKQLIYSTADPTSMRTRRAGGARDRACGPGRHRRPRPLCGCRTGPRHDRRSAAAPSLHFRAPRLSRSTRLRTGHRLERRTRSSRSFRSPVPLPKWGLLDRYLVAAEAAGLPSLIVITKLDLAWKNPQLDEDLAIYRRIGYPIQLVSSSIPAKASKNSNPPCREKCPCWWANPVWGKHPC